MIIWTPGRTLAEVERDVIFEALRVFQNNKVHTAKALGICYKTLNNKLEIYNGTTKLHAESGVHLESSDENSQEQPVSMPEQEKVQTLPPSTPAESDANAQPGGDKKGHRKQR